MNKNFEEEYRNMIDSDIPNLWDRIEPQLPPQNLSAGKAPAKPFALLRKNAALLISAAAALCLLFLLPLFPRQGNLKDGPNSIDYAGNDYLNRNDSAQNHTSPSQPNDSIINAFLADDACDNDSDGGYFPEDDSLQQAVDSPQTDRENLNELPDTMSNIRILSELKREKEFAWYLAEALQDGGELILCFSIQSTDETAAASPSVSPGQSYTVLLGTPRAYFSDTDGELSDIPDGTLVYPVSKWSPLEENP